MSNLLLFGLFGKSVEDVANDAIENIKDWFMNKLYSFLLLLDSIAYWLLSVAYKIFMKVSGVQLFSDTTGSQFDLLTKRIYSILGIVMLFVLAYNILKMIVNPDTLNDRSDSSMLGIIKNIIISLIIVALLPSGFKYLQKFQNRVLETNVLSHIIFGGSSTSSDTQTDSNDVDYGTTDAGADLAITIFTAFYHPVINNKVYSYNDCKNSTEVLCKGYIKIVSKALRNGNMSSLRTDAAISLIGEDSSGTYIEYYPVISFAAGVFAAYLMLSFAFDMGVRVAKLGVLQLIAPIPVIMRITKPKGGVFDKWFKELTKSYLQVFERLLIIFFALFTIQLLCASDGPIESVFSGEENVFIKLFAFVLVILGVLTFAKEAPKMLEDLFGMKIGEMSIKKKLDENTYAKKVAGLTATAGLGAVGGAIRRVNAAKERGYGGWGLVGSFLAGGVGGAFGGGLRGVKADYGKGSEGFKNAVMSAHQSNMEQGVKNEATRRKLEGTSSAGNVVSHIPGVNIVVGTGSNFIDSVVDGYDEIKDIVGGNGTFSLQGAVTIETDLKKSISLFMDNWANKGQYSNAKASRDNNAKDIVAGKISSADLSDRLKRVSGANLSVNATTGDITRTFADGTIKKYKNNMNELTKLNADIYKEMMQTMQGENLAKIVKLPDGSADYVNSKKQLDTRIKSLERDFQNKANSIPKEQRESILQGFEKLRNMEFTNIDDAKEYGIQLNNISDALENYININNNNLTSSNNGGKSK